MDEKMNIPLVDLQANYLSIKPEIDTIIQNVLTDAAFIKGPYLASFEKHFATFCQVKHAIGASSGTTALHLALLSGGITKGDEVITVPNTFIATTECISQVQARIKFVDVKKETALIDIDALEQAITKKTKAIVVVHLYGQMPDMKRIREIADDHDLFVIEDAAQAHASEWHGHQPGYYGDVATFSFFPAKNLGCYGDGGAVVTNDSVLADEMMLLVNHGRTQKYEHLIEGYNYRLDALQAAVLDVKLNHLINWTKNRRAHAHIYDENLPDEIITPVEQTDAFHTYYMYVIQIKQRDKLRDFLMKKGIHTGIHYPIPLHLQPAYQSLGLPTGSFPISEKLSTEILSLPVYPELTKNQQQYIINAIQEFFTLDS